MELKLLLKEKALTADLLQRKASTRSFNLLLFL